KWWGEVAESILEKHYYYTVEQRRVEENARFINATLSPYTTIMYMNESTNMMQDLISASIRTGQNTIVQKWGRFYSLSIARWLATVLAELSDIASHNYGIISFYGLSEHCCSYIVGDSFLKNRKIWPLRQ
ncbi:hypothetical protein O3Q96_004091, partial [Escherichia coli]|nr:hypothetical protein [Escherichia coli]